MPHKLGAHCARVRLPCKLWPHAAGFACPTSLAACGWVRLPYKLGAHGVRVRLPHKLGRTRLGPLALQALAARGRVRLPCKLCGRYAAVSACPASLTSPPPCLPPQANGSNGGNVALPRKGLSHRGAALKGACVWRAPPRVSRANGNLNPQPQTGQSEAAASARARLLVIPACWDILLSSPQMMG